MTTKFKLTVAIVFSIGVAAVLTNSCKKSTIDRRHPTTPITFAVPEGFPPPVYDFSANPLTEEGFALGRKLFHDHALSSHLDVTCSSCHQQHAAYTTFDHDLGHGTNHQHTSRNVPGIFNMVWHREFQWDGSVTGLEQQVLTCMTAPEKMGETVDGVVNKLSSDTAYRRLFSNAFGDDVITGDRIAKAITQFVAMIVSADSKYDRMKKGEYTFNASEQNGYQLFQTHCASCHAEPLFTDLSYRNNGLPMNPVHNDFGRMRVTGNSSDSLKFKVPSLRNVALTGYFAHDGRFPAFTQMIEHYSNGIEQSPTLDPSLKNGIPLTDLEKFYLQEFLFTLTDSSMVTDPRFE
jgi:cytochrome c peroxidase